MLVNKSLIDGPVRVNTNQKRKQKCLVENKGRETAEARRTTVLQPGEGKPHSHKDR